MSLPAPLRAVPWWALRRQIGQADAVVCREAIAVFPN
jgi:hypothetical protein